MAVRVCESMDNPSSHRGRNRRSRLGSEGTRSQSCCYRPFGCCWCRYVASMEIRAAQWLARPADLHKLCTCLARWGLALRLSRPHVQSFGHLSAHWSASLFGSRATHRRRPRGPLHCLHSSGSLWLRVVCLGPCPNHTSETIRVVGMGIRRVHGDDPGLAHPQAGSNQCPDLALGTR